MRLLAQADEAGALDWTVSVDSTMLGLQIRSGLRTAMGAAPTNFTTALDSPDFELAQQLVKDPYVFEHLGLVKSLAERDVAQALMDRLQDTMLQLGRGMAFVGRRGSLRRPRSDRPIWSRRGCSTYSGERHSATVRALSGGADHGIRSTLDQRPFRCEMGAARHG